VEMGMAGKDPSKMYNCTVIGKDTKGRATVYYFAFLYAQEEYRYVMKGSTIQLSNGQSLEYSNGKISEGNYVCVKMK